VATKEKYGSSSFIRAWNRLRILLYQEKKRCVGGVTPPTLPIPAIPYPIHPTLNRNIGFALNEEQNKPLQTIFSCSRKNIDIKMSLI
jgi:hypothetical protein